MRMARARALKAASALFVSELSPTRQLTAHMWWLFSPRMRSTCRVTPASKANDWSRCETISVDTKVSPRQEPTIHVQSPTFSRVKGRWQTKNGRDEMSMTARARD